MRSCFLSSVVEFRSVVSEEKSKMYQPTRGQCGHLVFRSARKTQTWRGRWDLASCQVSLNSVQQFQRRSRKCIGQSEARAAILFIGREHWDLASCKIRWISFSSFRGERPGRPSCFLIGAKKIGRGSWYLDSGQVSLNSVQRFQSRSQKCLSQSEARAAILFFFRSSRKIRSQRRSQKCLTQLEARAAILIVFLIGPKNTNLVDDVEILLPVKFRWILFSGFRREVENDSANKRPGRPSCFSEWPEKQTL